VVAGVSPDDAQVLFDAINEQLQGMHHRWHAWQDSELAHITQACHTGKPLVLSDQLVYLIREGAILERESQEYFNPAMGELFDLWGFLSHQSTRERAAPSPESIAAVLASHPSLHDLSLEGNVMTCHNPHVRLDLGSYAKGYGVGLIMDYLRSQGVKEALINAGGDLMILQPPGKAPARIGVKDPKAAYPLAVLSIEGSTSIFTSGTYARAFTDPNSKQAFHHLINPKTGYPSKDFVSVTVVHPDPVRADAAATALLAADRTEVDTIAQGMGIDKYLLIATEGERIVSPPMQTIIQSLQPAEKEPS
jgi:thiamine biosynthesis lipoprotein